MKVCSSCKVEKHIEDFGKDLQRKDGKNVYCKICVKQKSRDRHPFRKKKKYDPVKAAIYRSKLDEDRRNKIAHNKRKSFIKKAYGITIEQYDKMLESQKNTCAICERHSSSLKKTLAVDHNHVTLKVRGLLCAPCNRILGFLKIDETDKFIKNMISYYERNK